MPKLNLEPSMKISNGIASYLSEESNYIGHFIKFGWIESGANFVSLRLQKT